MRGRSSVVVRGGGRAAPPATLPPTQRCRCCRRRRPHALGASAGVRGHGAAGRAGGTAPTARSQAPPFHIGMGETAAAPGYGGATAGDGGAGDARALRRGRRASRLAAHHTAARWRVRPRRASTVTSPLSASRADEKQLPASTEQVRERRAGVGVRRRGHGRGRGVVRWRRGRGRAARHDASQRRRREEGRVVAEGDAVVGAHGRATLAALPAGREPATLRDGAAARGTLAAGACARARAARRVTPPRPRPRSAIPYHAYIPLSGRSDSECTRVPEYYRLVIYLFGTRDGDIVRVAYRVPCVRVPSLRPRRDSRLAPETSRADRAITKTEIK